MERINEIEALMRRAGEIMLSAREIENAVSEKEGSANFVTTYDVRVQGLLRQGLLELYPEAQFIGEEGDDRGDVSQGLAFIVDPIDGTTNFIKHYDMSVISVAMLRDGQVVLGAAYDPYRDEFYRAEKGRGAFCNDRPLRVSQLGLDRSLVCFGSTPYDKGMIPKTFALAQRLMECALDLRRSGSAVFDLCRVARGSAGLMFELRLSPWDYAAASLIVTEAGGRISQLDGTPLRFDRPCGVVAGSAAAYADFFAKGLDRL